MQRYFDSHENLQLPRACNRNFCSVGTEYLHVRFLLLIFSFFLSLPMLRLTIAFSFTFLSTRPAIIESQFGLSPAQTSIVFGLTLVLGATAGIAGGGWFCAWRKYDGVQTARFCMIAAGISVPFCLAFLLMGCEKPGWREGHFLFFFFFSISTNYFFSRFCSQERMFPASCWTASEI